MIEETYLYIWIDCRGRFYIGSHKGSLSGYISSSKFFNREYKKSPECFNRQILCIGNEDYIRLLETQFLKKLDAAKSPIYYNKWNGSSWLDGKVGGWNKGLPNKLRADLNRTRIYNHSEETKKKISQSCSKPCPKLKGRIPWNKGLKTGPRPLNDWDRRHIKPINLTMKGHNHTEETRKKMSISQLRRFHPEYIQSF